MKGNRNPWKNHQSSVDSMQYKPTTYTEYNVSLTGIWIAKPNTALLNSLGYNVLSLGLPVRREASGKSIFVLD